MSEITFDVSKSWIDIPDGERTTAVRVAAESAEALGEKPLKRRHRATLIDDLTKVARFRDESRALDMRVLCAARPVVRVLAYTVMHSTTGHDRVAGFVESASAPAPDSVRPATVTEHDNPLGRAYRVQRQDRPGTGRRAGVMPTIRWIQPMSLPERDITLVLTTFIPLEINVPLVAPLADAFVLGIGMRADA